MDTIINQVDSVLRTEFPGATTELELVDGKVWGYLLWNKFVGVDSADRVRRLSTALRRNLGKDYRNKISSIHPVTPREMKVMREELASPENN
jgi:hypothetical protein